MLVDGRDSGRGKLRDGQIKAIEDGLLR